MGTYGWREQSEGKQRENDGINTYCFSTEQKSLLAILSSFGEKSMAEI